MESFFIWNLGTSFYTGLSIFAFSMGLLLLVFILYYSSDDKTVVGALSFAFGPIILITGVIGIGILFNSQSTMITNFIVLGAFFIFYLYKKNRLKKDKKNFSNYSSELEAHKEKLRIIVKEGKAENLSDELLAFKNFILDGEKKLNNRFLNSYRTYVDEVYYISRNVIETENFKKIEIVLTFLENNINSKDTIKKYSDRIRKDIIEKFVSRDMEYTLKTLDKVYYTSNLEESSHIVFEHLFNTNEKEALQFLKKMADKEYFSDDSYIFYLKYLIKENKTKKISDFIDFIKSIDSKMKYGMIIHLLKYIEVLSPSLFIIIIDIVPIKYFYDTKYRIKESIEYYSKEFPDFKNNLKNTMDKKDIFVMDKKEYEKLFN